MRSSGPLAATKGSDGRPLVRVRRVSARDANADQTIDDHIDPSPQPVEIAVVDDDRIRTPGVARLALMRTLGACEPGASTSTNADAGEVGTNRVGTRPLIGLPPGSTGGARAERPSP
jgi:hypothetical protein